MAAGDLGPRLAVAAVGVPVVLALLYFGGWVLGVPLAVLAALGTGEVYDLAEARDIRPFRWLGMAASAGLVLGAVAFPVFSQLAPWAFGGLFAVTGVALLLAMVFRGPDGNPLAAVSVTVFGVLYVSTCFVFLALLHAVPDRLAWADGAGVAWGGLLVVVLPLAVTWIGDSVAYFAGTAFGRHKIWPTLSPNKSWEGSIAGLLGSALGAIIWLAVAGPLLARLPVTSMVVAAAMGAVMSITGQVGDFGESMLKREAGVKDSGSLFPGHGGVLDRLDALVFTLPTAYALLMAVEFLG